MSRYATFFKSISDSSKMTLRYLAKLSSCDRRTTLGRTLSRLMESCGLQKDKVSELNANLVKRKCHYKEPLPEELWQANIAEELHLARLGGLEVPGFNHQELEDMFHFTCVS